MMTKKIRKMNEISWLLGIVLCTLGVCLCTKANFGLSMIAAPPYIIHLRMVKLFPWYSQGTSEYLWQGILLIVLCIAVRRFRVRYLFSFLTAFLSGNMLDLGYSAETVRLNRCGCAVLHMFSVFASRRLR